MACKLVFYILGYNVVSATAPTKIIDNHGTTENFLHSNFWNHPPGESGVLITSGSEGSLLPILLTPDPSQTLEPGELASPAF